MNQERITTRKEKLRIAGATSLIWTLCLSSCAALNIKTWFLDGMHEQALIRRDSNGNIKEKLTFLEGDGYRCYSAVDDEAWRNRLIQCCAKAERMPTP